MAKKLIVSGTLLKLGTPEAIPPRVQMEITGEDMEVSDGYHTLREVYRHRYVLFMTLLRVIEGSGFHERPWKSKFHSDGTMFDDSFICGIGETAGSQITYHLPLKYWDELDIPARDNAPIWDGHTAADTLERLREL